MLPPFIIEQIRKREEDARRRSHETVKELHLPEPLAEDFAKPAPEPSDRGVVIIDLGG